MLFTITPVAGLDLTERSSAMKTGLLTTVLASDGRKYVYAKASEALASTSAVSIRNLGSASSLSVGSGATYDLGAVGNGGVSLAAPFFWARQIADGGGELSNWILALGAWNDSGVWDDAAFWEDS